LIQGFINTGTLYLPMPDGRGKYIILGLINPGMHRIESLIVLLYETFDMLILPLK
jgi:hypothetical protein